VLTRQMLISLSSPNGLLNSVEFTGDGLSTLPIAVQQAGVMAATIPAALLMARIGRRPGFWLGTAIGGVGAVIATWAIFRSSFEWFCFGTFLLGANRGATQQYRFAAAEIADDAFRPLADWAEYVLHAA
jgi:MFS family permease